MRAALYQRVSTQEQTSENQRSALESFCSAHGLEIVARYQDTDSGGHAARTGFQHMMQDARRRRFKLLVFWSLDRLSREGVAATIGHIQRLHSYGVQVRSVKQPEIDTTAPWGYVIISIFAALAEIEKKLLSERTRAGLARARSQGKTLGRPRGPQVSPKQQAAVEDPRVSLSRLAAILGVSKSTAARTRRSSGKHQAE